MRISAEESGNTFDCNQIENIYPFVFPPIVQVAKCSVSCSKNQKSWIKKLFFYETAFNSG